VDRRPPPPIAPPPDAAPSFLDQEPEDGAVDGVEAGRRLAEGYRSNQGGATSTGPTTRFRARERSPRQLRPVEVPTVATLRHVIVAEEAYNKHPRRYA